MNFFTFFNTAQEQVVDYFFSAMIAWIISVKFFPYFMISNLNK